MIRRSISQNRMGEKSSMVDYDFIKMEKKLSDYLDESRYIHTQGVMYTAAAMAMAHGCDLTKARVAGLLHDCAKCIPNKKKLKLCKEHDIAVTEFEKEHPFLIHAKLGAYIASRKYNVDDPEILSAIACHTTGKPAMTDLEKIIYIADYIEPGRDKAPNLARIRYIAFQNLDECMYEILRDTLQYLDQGSSDIDNATVEAFQYYSKIHEDRT